MKLTYNKAYKGYVADVINLYGCMSQGKTKKEAVANTKKAIKAYMEVFKKSEAKKPNVKEIITIPLSFSTHNQFSYA